MFGVLLLSMPSLSGSVYGPRLVAFCIAEKERGEEEEEGEQEEEEKEEKEE